MKIFYLLISIFCIHNLNAQDTLSDKNIALKNNLNEVVVTGQLSETTAEDAVHKIRVIGSNELNSGLFTDLASALSKRLNIRLSEDNILGSSISIQGISGQNVKILIDDVPIIGRLNGNIDLSQINLNNIERIEIVEGPLSTIYGTDALAGTVNIITKEQTINQKSLTTYYETIGKYNYDFLLAENIKENTVTYGFSRKFFNGWSSDQKFRLVPIRELADKNRNKQWKPKEKISHKLSFKKNKDLYSYNNYIERFHEKITNRGIPLEPYYENAFDEYYHTFKTNLGSDIKFKYEKHKIRLLLAHNKYTRTKATFYKNLTDLSEIIVLDDNMQDTSQFKLWMAKVGVSKDYNKLKYQIGVDLNKQSAKGDRISEGYQEKGDYALFSIIEYKANDIIVIRPSLRIIYNTKYKAPIIPAINTLFKWGENKIRISYAKGFRAPDFKELFFEFIDVNHNILGNELLLAEESNNFNINTTISKKLIKTKIVSDISLFYNNISNKIDLLNSSLETNQYSYFNIAKYETKGISYRSTILISNTEINFGISYIGRYNKFADEYNLAKFNFSQDLNINALFQIGKKTKLNIYYKKTGEIPIFTLDNNDVVEVYSDTYNMLDFSINRRIYNNITITIGAKNLFNITDIKQSSENNTVHSNNNNTISVGYGRTFFTSLKFKL